MTGSSAAPTPARTASPPGSEIKRDTLLQQRCCERRTRMAKQIDQEQILDGARRALAIHGLHGTTLEVIAEQAGVSRVTLYRRGTTRESIMAELAERAAEEYRRAL